MNSWTFVLLKLSFQQMKCKTSFWWCVSHFTKKIKRRCVHYSLEAVFILLIPKHTILHLRERKARKLNCNKSQTWKQNVSSRSCRFFSTSYLHVDKSFSIQVDIKDVINKSFPLSQLIFMGFDYQDDFFIAQASQTENPLKLIEKLITET